jgi:hypothetical protein
MKEIEYVGVTALVEARAIYRILNSSALEANDDVELLVREIKRNIVEVIDQLSEDLDVAN